jgi:putative DNA primase/helicase
LGIALKHLSEGQRAELARELFKVTSTEESKGEIHGLCPIHQETNPSFAYNFKKDVYHCLACGADGDLLKLWSEVNGYGQKDGFKAFCTKYAIDSGQGDKGTGARREGGGGGEAPLKDIDLEAVWELFPSLPDPWVERLGKIRGWSRRWIEILDLRLQTHYQHKTSGALVKVKKPERIAIPIRDAAGKLVNIRLYLPGGGQYKIISWAKSTGQARLFPSEPSDMSIDGDKQLATMPQDGTSPAGTGKSTSFLPVILCEGESDTICALSHGFNAITQTSKLKNWPAEHLAPFKDCDVVIAYDADAAGVKYGQFAARALTGVAKSIRTIQWPAFMGVDDSGAYPENHGQDLTDFFVTHKKTPDDLKALIDAAKPQDAAPGSPAPPPAAGEIAYMDFFARGVNDRLSFKPRKLADRILQELTLLSDPETGLMYRWNGHFWESFDEDHVRAVALRYLSEESQKSRAEDAAYQVKMLCTLPHGRTVNDQVDWICLQNGMFNLRTYELAPHGPDYYCTYTLPVSFDPDSNKTCTRWIKYLEQTVQTPEAIAQLQEYLGYVLVRHTKFEKCLLLVGPGADGKSTFLKIMKELVGDENCAAVSFQDLEDQFQRSSLYGKLLNISTEVGAKAIESPYFKAITSGDPINAAFKHKNAFTFSPYCKLAFAANRLPRVLDNSDGFFRRVLPVRFKRQFLDDDPDKDSELFEILKGELSEIFAWAVVGLARLVENRKFTGSEETRAMMQDYRRINNPVLCYVEDQCIVDDDAEVEKKAIYEDYRTYCGKNGYTFMNRENFFRELYVAVSNLKQYQHRVDGIPKRSIKGIKVNVYAE